MILPHSIQREIKDELEIYSPSPRPNKRQSQLKRPSPPPSQDPSPHLPTQLRSSNLLPHSSPIPVASRSWGSPPTLPDRIFGGIVSRGRLRPHDTAELMTTIILKVICLQSRFLSEEVLSVGGPSDLDGTVVGRKRIKGCDCSLCVCLTLSYFMENKSMNNGLFPVISIQLFDWNNRKYYPFFLNQILPPIPSTLHTIM